MRVAIVGAEAAKFSSDGVAAAKKLIYSLLYQAGLGEMPILVSGGCHLGGIDIWAEQIADTYGYGKQIYKPAKLQWEGGYKQRNLLIAQNCDELHNIVVATYPPTYSGMTFKGCYHCARHPGEVPPHIKSGGCWTAWKAKELGKAVEWHVI